MKCKICGKKFDRVCTHIRQKHKISAREYKKMFGLDLKRGLISEKDRAIMRKHTLTNGTVRNVIEGGVATRFKKGHKVRYERSQQTLDRIKNLYKYTKAYKKKHNK